MYAFEKTIVMHVFDHETGSCISGGVCSSTTYGVFINEWLCAFRGKDKVLFGQLHHLLLDVEVAALQGQLCHETPSPNLNVKVSATVHFRKQV